MEASDDNPNLRLTAKGRRVTANASPTSVTKTEATFDVVLDEAIHPPPVSKLANRLAVLSFGNLVFYLLALFLNIYAAWAQGKGFRVLTVPFIFALSQLFEHCSAITEAMWHFCVFLNKKHFARPVLYLQGKDVPPVVMIIVTCGEPLDIIMDTVRAALHVDYPPDKLRVIVADDGNQATLKDQVSLFQVNHTHLHYTSRSGGKGYKAGNLNNCLRSFVPTLNFKYDWICVLDADMMPEPEILRALLPHAIGGKRIGMVTTGQHFYNIPDNDPLYQSNITGTHAEDGARDSVGTAWCPGSGFVMLRRAWADIGGFPEYAITEDLFTSWQLHGRGWKTMLVHQVLQWGLQPDCFVVHMKQRRRWWTGHLSRVIKTGLSLSDATLYEATFVQRYAMFQHCLRPFNNTVFKAVSLMLITVCIATGQKVLAIPGKWSVFVIFFSVLIRSGLARYNEVKDLPDLDRIWNMRRRHATNTWLGLHFAIDTVKAVLPTLFPGKIDIKPLGFDVSGVEEKEEDSAHERNASQRRGFLHRVRLLHRKEGILYHPLMAIAVGALMAYQFSRLDQDSDGFWFEFACSVGFPGLGMIELLPLESTPLLYAIFPPVMSERRALMVYDDDEEVWRPTTEAKKMKWTASTSIWLEVPHILAFAWLLIVLFKHPWSFVRE